MHTVGVGPQSDGALAEKRGRQRKAHRLYKKRAEREDASITGRLILSPLSQELRHVAEKQTKTEKDPCRLLYTHLCSASWVRRAPSALAIICNTSCRHTQGRHGFL